jgi:hypothetical protein
VIEFESVEYCTRFKSRFAMTAVAQLQTFELYGTNLEAGVRGEDDELEVLHVNCVGSVRSFGRLQPK